LQPRATHRSETIIPAATTARLLAPPVVLERAVSDASIAMPVASLQTTTEPASQLPRIERAEFFAEMNSRFVVEPVDWRWASLEEPRLHQVVSTLFSDCHLRELRCASTMCRIVLELPSGHLMGMRDRVLGNDAFAHGGAISNVEIEVNGLATQTVFVQRGDP